MLSGSLVMWIESMQAKASMDVSAVRLPFSEVCFLLRLQDVVMSNDARRMEVVMEVSRFIVLFYFL
jgi:hypothetical protein